MKDKILFLLEELKENYTDQIFKDTLEVFREEIDIRDFNINHERSKNALNGQSKKFYNELAFDFVEDLNEFTEMYFLFWEPLFYFFNDQTLNYFWEIALELAHLTDAKDYIVGLKELNNGNPETAQFYFNNINDYVSSYFIAICYLDIENFENSIKQNEKFLKNLESTIEKITNINLEKNENILILKWNLFSDIAYAYNRISEFGVALEFYNKTFDIFSLEENYEINHSIKINESLDEFKIFANNYLLALEKNRNYEKCIQVLNFLIEKYPIDYYYKSKLEKLLLLSLNQTEESFIFNQIFRPKRPFNIDKIEVSKLVSKEKILEDLILEQIKHGISVFGKSLELYNTEDIYGKQYVIPKTNKRIDLLLIDNVADQLYVVELKRNKAGIEVVSQIENYMISLSKQLNRKVKGIICLHESSNQLNAIVRTKKDIELFTYKFEFKNEL